VDFSVTRYLLVGVATELLFNVLPDIWPYPGGITMLNVTVRMVGVAPLTTRLSCYGVVAAGYSAMFANGIGNPRGPVLEGRVGVTFTVMGPARRIWRSWLPNRLPEGTPRSQRPAIRPVCGEVLADRIWLAIRLLTLPAAGLAGVGHMR
jgi:hypothetical protein